MQHTVYGARWVPSARFMLAPVDEDEARSRYTSGEPLVMAAAPEPLLGLEREVYDGQGGSQPASWALHTHICDTEEGPRGFLEVTYFSPTGLKEAWHWFMRLSDGRLFLQEVHEFSYADPDNPNATWTQWRQYTYRPDGHSKELITEISPERAQSMRMTEYGDADFSSHYEPVPEFGQWSGVLRRQG